MARRRRGTRAGMIRKTARRAYKKRRRSTKKRSSPKSASTKIYDVVKKIVPFYAFASQISAKDYADLQGTDYNSQDIATKGKIFANIVLGRLSGFTPFKSGNLYGSQNTPFTINPNGMVNKFTGLGIGGLIYKNLPIKQLPMKSKVGVISKGLIAGGLIGGLFDPPMNTSTPSSNQQVLGRSMSVIQQNRSATMGTGMFAGSNDSTRGSFN